MKKTRITLLLLTLTVVLLPANASNSVFSEQSWGENQTLSSLHVPKNPILRRFDANRISFKTFITALCKQADVYPIFDKSVFDVLVTATYSDRTIAEILTDLCQKQGFKCRNLADNILLIETPDAETAVYPRHREEQLPEQSPTLSAETRSYTVRPKYKYGLIPPPPPIVPFPGIPPAPPPILP